MPAMSQPHTTEGASCSELDAAAELPEQAIAEARKGRIEHAETLLKRALEPGLSRGHRASRARLELAQAHVEYFKDSAEPAARTAEQAKVTALEAGAPGLAARAAALQAACVMRFSVEVDWHRMLGLLAEARSLAASSFGSHTDEQARDAAEVRYLADFITGAVEHYAGRLAHALEAYQRAFDHCRAIGDSTGMCAMRYWLGYAEASQLREQWLERLLGGESAPHIDPAQLAHVESLILASMQLARDCGAETDKPGDLLSLGFVHMVGRQPARALALLDSALAALPKEEASGHPLLARADRVFALLSAGRSEEAVVDSQQLPAAAHSPRAPALAATSAWLARRSALLTQGDLAGAMEAETRALLDWDRYLSVRQRIRRALTA